MKIDFDLIIELIPWILGAVLIFIVIVLSFQSLAVSDFKEKFCEEHNGEYFGYCVIDGSQYDVDCKVNALGKCYEGVLSKKIYAIEIIDELAGEKLT